MTQIQIRVRIVNDLMGLNDLNHFVSTKPRSADPYHCFFLSDFQGAYKKLVLSEVFCIQEALKLMDPDPEHRAKHYCKSRNRSIQCFIMIDIQDGTTYLNQVRVSSLKYWVYSSKSVVASKSVGADS